MAFTFQSSTNQSTRTVLRATPSRAIAATSASPTPRERAAALTPAIADALELELDDLIAAVMARTLSWTHRLIFRAAFSRLLAGEDQRQVAASLRVDAARAYDKLQRGFA